jgi:hypothetical protein
MTGPGQITANPTTMASVTDTRNDIIDYIQLRLGAQMVDVELDREHYLMSIKQALIRYRQRTEHSVEESYAFLELMPDTQEYILPKEIMAVHAIYRRGLGGLQTATQFEPFSSGFLNTYMLVAGRVGGLTNYELFVDYQKLTMTMFGGYITFNFNEATKKLVIHRRMPGEYSSESVLLRCYNYKPDQAILNDSRAFPWVQDYAYAMSKHMLGEAREKFAQIAGPQGGSSLNGTALKTEATAEMTQLIEDLKQYVDASTPLTWVTG